ncbi:hypothetical protein D3C73_1213940 [compost metagenome]
MEIRVVLRHQTEGAEYRIGIGQRITRACNSNNGQLGQTGHRPDYLVSGLLRRQHLADNARPAFIDTVKLRVAVVAANIAFGRHRCVHACKMMMRLFAVTGMLQYSRIRHDGSSSR